MQSGHRGMLRITGPAKRCPFCGRIERSESHNTDTASRVAVNSIVIRRLRNTVDQSISSAPFDFRISFRSGRTENWKCLYGYQRWRPASLTTRTNIRSSSEVRSLYFLPTDSWLSNAVLSRQTTSRLSTFHGCVSGTSKPSEYPHSLTRHHNMPYPEPGASQSSIRCMNSSKTPCVISCRCFRSSHSRVSNAPRTYSRENSSPDK